MLVGNQIAGEFIVLANSSNTSRYDSIGKSLDDLIDLIRIRVKENTIEEVANGLLESLFNLRGQLHKLQGREKFIDLVQEGVTKELVDNIQLSPYSELANSISKVLMVYGDIVAPLFSLIKGDKTSKESPVNMEYSALEVISDFPSSHLQYFKKWADSSLQLEMGLIISNLIKTGKISISKKRINTELIEFMYDSITRFGAYAILLKIWTPDEDDMSNLTNRMLILSTAIQFNNGEGIRHEMSVEGLRNLL